MDAKADASPVTEADRQAEAAMRELIRASFPGHAIFGEEGGMQAAQPAEDGDSGTSSYLWVLDPIDGTKSFITGASYPLHACKEACTPCKKACTPWPSVGLAAALPSRSSLHCKQQPSQAFWGRLSQRSVAMRLMPPAATGKPVFGTLIALLRDGVPVLGIINQPITKERWLGVAGRQTTLNGGHPVLACAHAPVATHCTCALAAAVCGHLDASPEQRLT